MLAPTYVSENSPRAIRGLLIGFYQLFETMGAMIAFFIDYGSLLHIQVSRSSRFTGCLSVSLTVVRAAARGWYRLPCNLCHLSSFSSASCSVRNRPDGSPAKTTGMKRRRSFRLSVTFRRTIRTCSKSSSNCELSWKRTAAPCMGHPAFGLCRRNVG